VSTSDGTLGVSVSDTEHRAGTTRRFTPFRGNPAEQKWDGASAVRNIDHGLPAVKKTDRFWRPLIGTIAPGWCVESVWDDCVSCNAARCVGRFALPCARPFLDQIPSGRQAHYSAATGHGSRDDLIRGRSGGALPRSGAKLRKRRGRERLSGRRGAPGNQVSGSRASRWQSFFFHARLRFACDTRQWRRVPGCRRGWVKGGPLGSRRAARVSRRRRA